MNSLEATLQNLFEKSKRKTVATLKTIVERTKQTAHEVTIDELKKTKEKGFSAKLIEYGTIGGLLTGSKQNELAKEVGVRNLEFTEWSILLGFMIAYAKYFGGELSQHIPWIGKYADMSFDTWANVTSLTNLYRFAYIKTAKQPISSIYVWLAYSMPKKIIQQLEKEIKIDGPSNL